MIVPQLGHHENMYLNTFTQECGKIAITCKIMSQKSKHVKLFEMFGLEIYKKA